MHHTNRSKVKNHVVISIVAEKTLDKIQKRFMLKTPYKTGVERPKLNMIKAI